MLYIAAVLLFNLSVLATGKLNYCGARMCSYTNAHTFCQFAGGPGPQCIGYVEIPLTTDEKIKLVIRLNQRRAAVAKGRLRGFPTAGNMMKLMWMEELAREAQLWADQCEPPSTPEENDACRDLYSVAIGQCVASVIGEAPGLRAESMVDIWYMQNMFYRGNITSYDPPVNNRYNYYGDFAQLVYSKTYMVGCGRSRFMVLMSGRLRSVERLVCNFAPRGPSAGRPLWTVASPGTACPPRSLPDDNVPALCTVQSDLDETHDQDNMMSLEEHILLETVFEIEKNESLNYIGILDEIFLTKVAVATIGDVVTVPMDFNTVQKRDLLENNDDLKTQIGQENLSTETFKPTTTVVLVGRPKSYNIEELNEGNDEFIDNSDTQMQDLPIKEKHFDVDYEFSESNEERRRANTEKSTTIINMIISTVSNIVTAQYVTENINPSTTMYEEKNTIKEDIISPPTIMYEEKNAIKEEIISPPTIMYEEKNAIKEDILSPPTIMYEQQNTIREEIIAPYTLGVTPYTEKEFINNMRESNNVIIAENDTDALLEEYLNDPETVRRLQEELDRMEQALSTDSTKNPSTKTTSERADKVRRALKDGVTETNRDQTERPYTDNSSLQLPPMLQTYTDDNGNKSAANPVISMAMKYIPYLRNYKAGIMNSALGHSNTTHVHSSFILVVICILCNVL